MHLSLWRVVPGAYLNSHHQNLQTVYARGSHVPYTTWSDYSGGMDSAQHLREVDQ